MVNKCPEKKASTIVRLLPGVSHVILSRSVCSPPIRSSQVCPWASALVGLGRHSSVVSPSRTKRRAVAEVITEEYQCGQKVFKVVLGAML